MSEQQDGPETHWQRLGFGAVGLSSLALMFVGLSTMANARLLKESGAGLLKRSGESRLSDATLAVETRVQRTTFGITIDGSPAAASYARVGAVAIPIGRSQGLGLMLVIASAAMCVIGYRLTHPRISDA